MKMKKLTSIALVAALAIGTFGFSVPAKAAENSTDYTITIPATLNVVNAGWNATDGITAQVKSGDTFDTSKTLTVTAASTNSWALKSGENSVGYNLATAEAAYSASAQPASWEFSAEELNASGGTNKAMGINVQDYTAMAIPAGNYTDTVTFTAKVGDAAPATTTLDNTTTTWAAGTYVVPAGGLTYSAAISVTGDVTLVLTDNETLRLNKGISIADGATLTIEGNGTMNVNGTNENTTSTVAGAGTLVLTSGILTAKGGNGASVANRNPGMDSRANAGGNAINGNVTVSGGTLTATGGNGGGVGNTSDNSYGAVGGAAISGNVTITAGTVTATGGNGGSVGSSRAYGGAGGAAINGDVTINGGTLTQNEGTNGANGSGNGGAGGASVAGTVTDNR